MFVVNTPNQDLALTNFAFCSPADFRALGTRGSGLVFALLGDSVVLSIRYPLNSFFAGIARSGRAHQCL